MFIKPMNNAKDLWEIDEEMASEALLFARREDTPLPWDATIEVQGDKVILEGSIMGSGASLYKNSGYCRCEISVDKFPTIYRLQVSVSEDDLDKIEKLESAGWIED